MKTRAAPKLICQACQYVRRHGKLFVRCPVNAKHKQRQGYSHIASFGQGQNQLMQSVGNVETVIQPNTTSVLPVFNSNTFGAAVTGRQSQGSTSSGLFKTLLSYF